MLGFAAFDRTNFEAIRQVPPGARVTLERAAPPRVVGVPTDPGGPRDVTRAVDRIVGRLRGRPAKSRRTVASRTANTFRWRIALSGGIDSTIIAGLSGGHPPGRGGRRRRLAGRLTTRTRRSPAGVAAASALPLPSSRWAPSSCAPTIRGSCSRAARRVRRTRPTVSATPCGGIARAPRSRCAAKAPTSCSSDTGCTSGPRRTWIERSTRWQACPPNRSRLRRLLRRRRWLAVVPTRTASSRAQQHAAHASTREPPSDSFRPWNDGPQHRVPGARSSTGRWRGSSVSVPEPARTARQYVQSASSARRQRSAAASGAEDRAPGP